MLFLDSYKNEVNGKSIAVSERSDFSTFYNETFKYIPFFQKSNAIVLVEDTVKRPGEVLAYAYFKHTEASCNGSKPTIYNRFWNGSFLKEKPIFPEKYRNYHKCNFTINTLPSAPYLMITSKGNKTILDGSDGIMLTNLAERLNFTVAFETSEASSIDVSTVRMKVANG